MAQNFLVKLLPKLDAAAWSKMISELDGKFDKIAKNFGKKLAQQLKATATGGGAVAFGAMIAAKVLNPLQKVNEEINKALGKADTVATLAGQFGADSRGIQNTLSVLKVKGVGEDEATQLLTRFQQFADQEKTKNEEDRVIKGLTGKENGLEIFWNTMKGLSQIKNADQRMGSAGAILGGRPVGKVAELISDPNFEEILKQIKIVPDKLIEFGDKSEERQRLLEVNRDNLVTGRALQNLERAQNNGSDIIQMQSDLEQQQRLRAANKIGDFGTLASLENSLDSVTDSIQKALTTFAPLIAKAANGLADLVGFVSKISKPGVGWLTKNLFGG